MKPLRSSKCKRQTSSEVSENHTSTNLHVIIVEDYISPTQASPSNLHMFISF